MAKFKFNESTVPSTLEEGAIVIVDGVTYVGNSSNEPVKYSSNDTSDISGASWVLDEDDFASDSDTKVPTQQSAKKYVDDKTSLFAINVKDYGAIGDGNTDDTEAVQSAISAANAMGGGIVFFPKGIYRIEICTIHDNVIFKGVGKEASQIRPLTDPATANGLIKVRGSLKNAEIRDLGFYIDVDVEKKCIDINNDGAANIIDGLTIDNCLFKSLLQHNQLVTIGPIQKNTRITNNKFHNYDGVATRVGESSLQIAASTDYTGDVRRNPINIHLNEFEGGGNQLDVSNSCPAPLFVVFNSFYNFYGRALFMHAPQSFEIAYNHVKNGVAPSGPANDGAAMWVDGTGSPSVRNSFKVQNNIITDIEGNGIYLEELVGGDVSDNEILRCVPRTDDTFSTDLTIENSSVAQTYTSDGGHGIVLTGGCRRLNLNENRIERCENGIVLDRGLGVHWEKEIRNIYITGGKIAFCQEWGIVNYGITSFVDVSGVKFIDNGEKAADTYGAILLDTTPDLENFNTGFFVSGCHFLGSPEGSGQQYHALMCTYEFTNKFFTFTDNPIVDGDGFWVKFNGFNTATITGNHFTGNGELDVTPMTNGTLNLKDNTGYKNYGRGSRNISSSNTETIVTHEMDVPPGQGLMVTPTTLLGNATQFWVDEITDTTFKIKVDQAPGQTISFYWSFQT